MKVVRLVAATVLAALCLAPPVPGPAEASVAVEMLIQVQVSSQIALAMIPQPGQGLSVAMPIAGETATVSMWSASDPLLWAKRVPSSGTCFAPPAKQLNSSGGLCHTPANELLKSFAPRRNTPAPRPEDGLQGIPGAFFDALIGGVTPGPTPLRKVSPDILEALRNGNSDSALEHAEKALRGSIEKFGTEHVETALALGLIGQLCLATMLFT